MEAQSGNGGPHLYFTYPKEHDLRNTTGVLGKSIDTRANGGYIVLPPSQNGSGVYKWITVVKPVPLPDHLLRTLLSPPPASPGSQGRNSELAERAGKYVKKGLSEAEVRARILADNQSLYKNHPDGPLTEDEIERTVFKSVAKWISERVVSRRVSEKPGVDILLGGQQNEDVAQVLVSLWALNEQQPRIFAHGDEIKQLSLVADIKEPDITRPSLRTLDQHSLTNLMAEASDYYHVKEKPAVEEKKDKNDKVIREAKEAEDIYVNCYPPPKLANAILALTPDKRGFPTVKAVIEAPTFRKNGSLITQAGYDVESGYFYYPSRAMQNIVLPTKPTKDDVIAARNVLWNVFGEFPYVSDSDRANNFAFGLTLFARQLIDGIAPMCANEASIAGSGKGLNTDVWAHIAIGKPAIKCPPFENIELEKRIFSFLSAGCTLIGIDNVRGKLKSTALESALTGDTYTGRPLTTSTIRTVPNLATWFVNGNNMTLDGDLPRRSYRVRFTPDTAQPWLKEFRIKDLRTYALHHRIELVQACITIIQGWLHAGSPVGDSNVKPLGNFESWTTTMNGILTYAEIGGFLGNMQEFYAENGDDAQQLTAFIEAGVLEYVGRKVTTQEIVADIEKGGPLLDSLPPDLAAIMKDKDATTQSRAKAIGYKLRTYRDRPFGENGSRVVRGEPTSTKTATWKFVETVTRNLTSWDNLSTGDAGDAGDSFSSEKIEIKKVDGEISQDEDDKNQKQKFLGMKTSPVSPVSPVEEDEPDPEPGSTAALLQTGTGTVHANGHTPSPNGRITLPNEPKSHQLSEGMRAVLGSTELFAAALSKEG